MEEKNRALQYIKSLAEQGTITRSELIEAFDSINTDKHDGSLTKKPGVSEVMYYIGGGIVFLGIAILLIQNWTSLSLGTKLLSTLGAGIGAFLVGFLLSRQEKTESVGSAFYLIYALITPIGIGVALNNDGGFSDIAGLQSIISGTMLVSCLIMARFLHKQIFVLFSILFATWFYFALSAWIIGGNPLLDSWQFYMYLILFAGAAYTLLGHAFTKSNSANLSGFLYGFGILAVLGSTFALGDWSPSQNIIWELVYPFLIFGTLFISTSIKRRSFLIWGTIFLMAFILKITSEYFTSSLGWPLALVIAGLALMGVGYMSLSIKKKYLSSN